MANDGDADGDADDDAADDGNVNEQVMEHEIPETSNGGKIYTIYIINNQL